MLVHWSIYNILEVHFCGLQYKLFSLYSVQSYYISVRKQDEVKMILIIT